mgnify:CR=1 FL=1
MSRITAPALYARAIPSPVASDGFVVYLYSCPNPPDARITAEENIDSDIYSDVAYNQSEVDDIYLNNRFEVQVLVKNENQAEIIPIVYDRETQDYITFNQLVEAVESKLDKECTVEVDAGGRWDSNFECLFPETDEVTLECFYDNLDDSFRSQFESIAEDLAREVREHQKDGEVQER